MQGRDELENIFGGLEGGDELDNIFDGLEGVTGIEEDPSIVGGNLSTRGQIAQSTTSITEILSPSLTLPHIEIPPVPASNPFAIVQGRTATNAVPPGQPNNSQKPFDPTLFNTVTQESARYFPQKKSTSPFFPLSPAAPINLRRQKLTPEKGKELYDRIALLREEEYTWKEIAQQLYPIYPDTIKTEAAAKHIYKNYGPEKNKDREERQKKQENNNKAAKTKMVNALRKLG